MRFLLSVIVLAPISTLSWAQDGRPAEPAARGDIPPSRSLDVSSSEIVARLQALPRPGQQKDLNTLELASAHRERAASMQEKTDGLWQSWLVSVCEGCGPERRPFVDRDGEDYLQKLRARQAQTKPDKPPGASEKPRYTDLYPTAGDRTAELGSVAADLSNTNIDRIRRDPNR